jgi:integrase
VGTVLEATTDDRLHALWVTIATTGLRRGEALALRWVDVDQMRGALRCLGRWRGSVDRRP